MKSIGPGLRGGRKMDGEDRSQAGLALDLEQAAVMADDMLDDGEAEPGAAERARTRGIDAVEALGEAGNMLARDAAAVVAHAERDAAAVAGARAGKGAGGAAGLD